MMMNKSAKKLTLQSRNKLLNTTSDSKLARNYEDVTMDIQKLHKQKPFIPLP